MNLKKLILSMALVGLVMMTGCNPDDEENPVINLFKPVEGSTFVGGTVIPFEATFTDDVELKNYQIDIHQNFEGGVLDAWTYDVTNQLDNASKAETADCNLAEDINSGEYVFRVFCRDQALNEVETQVLINIVNGIDGIAPSLSIDSPGGNVTTGPGEVMTVSGTAGDNGELKKVIAIIRDADETILTSEQEDNISASVFDYSLNLATPGSAGEYTVTVGATDTKNNQTTESFTLTVQ